MTVSLQLQVSGQYRHHGTKHASAPSLRKDKEPKFVPYEPYKAAITPLVATKKKRSASNLTRQASGEDLDTTATSLNSSSPSVVVQQEKEREDCADTKQKLKENAETIEALQREMAEKDKQLKIQMQVGSVLLRTQIKSAPNQCIFPAD